MVYGSQLKKSEFPLSAPLVRTAKHLNLDQKWAMFDLDLAFYGGWLEAEGTLANGAAVDVTEGIRA